MGNRQNTTDSFRARLLEATTVRTTPDPALTFCDTGGLTMEARLPLIPPEPAVGSISRKATVEESNEDEEVIVERVSGGPSADAKPARSATIGIAGQNYPVLAVTLASATVAVPLDSVTDPWRTPVKGTPAVPSAAVPPRLMTPLPEGRKSDASSEPAERNSRCPSV